MPIEVSGEALNMSEDWKKISKHIKRVRPEVSKACEDAVREVLSKPDSEADAAVAAIGGAAQQSDGDPSTDTDEE